MAHQLSRKLQQAIRQAKRFAAALPGVRGVDYGVVYRDESPTRTFGIRFHMAHKKVPGEIASSEFIPKAIDGIPCDVIAAGYMPHAESMSPAQLINPRKRVDPLCPGLSIGGLTRHSAGTLGVFVHDRHDQSVAILSNWHVLAGDMNAQPGEQIVQPATFFLGMQLAHTVAHLTRWLSPDLGYDAAIATLSADSVISTRIANVDLALQGIVEPQVGMEVVKSGAVSDVTHAVVDGIEGSFLINYGRFGAGHCWVNGIRIVSDPATPLAEISLAGDSGSLWVERSTGLAVALHFAGEDNLSPLSEYALAHPLAGVLARLDVDLHLA